MVTRQALAAGLVVMATVGSVAVQAGTEPTGSSVAIAAHDRRRAGMRVRSSSAAIAGLIRSTTERSATFRRLVDFVNASDGIVYVDAGSCPGSVRACLVSIVQAGPSRFVYVKVDTRRDSRALASAIGHELQHAVEVLSDTGVTSNGAMYFFYLRTGHRAQGKTFETLAALDVGWAVLSEIGEDFANWVERH